MTLLKVHVQCEGSDKKGRLAVGEDLPVQGGGSNARKYQMGMRMNAHSHLRFYLRGNQVKKDKKKRRI